MAAAGDPDITNKLLKGYEVGGKTYKVHLDGYNQLPYLTGQEDHSARNQFIYFNDDGDLVALRYENWKAVFEEQRVTGTLRIWAEPFTKLRLPKLFNLRSDRTSGPISHPIPITIGLCPTGRVHFSRPSRSWRNSSQRLKTNPPSQRPSSFSIDQLVEKMQRSYTPSGD
jgi:arylsulfatase